MWTRWDRDKIVSIWHTPFSMRIWPFFIWISLKFVFKHSIDNKSALVQVKAWCRPCTKQCWPSSLTHICGTKKRRVKGHPNKTMEGITYPYILAVDVWILFYIFFVRNFIVAPQTQGLYDDETLASLDPDIGYQCIPCLFPNNDSRQANDMTGQHKNMRSLCLWHGTWSISCTCYS